MQGMSADIDSINHVGMAVRDLGTAARCYEAMGFQLTPYSPHSGAWKPGEAVKPLGSGNRCVMLPHNYLEILASENPRQPAERIEAFLRHHQGAHIICFNSEVPDAIDARLRAAGLRTSGVIPLQREIDTPDGVRTAKFQRVQFAPDDSPEGYIQVARHLTPEYIYQPRYTAHANGCTALSDTIVVADDVGHFAAKYARYLGVAPVRADGAARFRFSLVGHLTIVGVGDVPRFLPGTLLPPLPGIAGVVFRVPDLAAQRARLAAAGFVVRDAGARLLVCAEDACGVAVLFET
ncbi:MAG: VOC family protein [Burkholderiales bacterium]|nr:VOC family protein [Burkholderiales bacterium]